MTMKIHLIRHGRTQANEQRLYCGNTDIPLSGAGREELVCLRESLPYPSGRLYIVSGLSRTIQTAEILFGNPPYEVFEGLREIGFGSFEMHSHQELLETPEYLAWIGDVDHRAPPGGEGKKEFVRRIVQSFWEVKKLGDKIGGEATVIITHGGVISGIMEHLFPGTHNFYEWQPEFGRGYTIIFENNNCISYQSI